MNNKPKILIVEDTDNARKTIKNILSDLECDFSEAAEGKKALALIRKKTFDVIIIDVGLPGGMNGIETFKRAKDIKPKLPPVIMITGYLDAHYEDEAGKLGAFAYLRKDPLSEERLTEAVLRAMNA